MARLSHNYAAFLRLMEISDVQLNVFVEGKEQDSFFYGQLVTSALRGRTERHHVHTANQLDSATTGKPGLLAFFKFLSDRTALSMTRDGRRKTVVFFLDKDIDDIRGTVVVSPNLIYSLHYEVENDIFLYSDLRTACAATASVDVGDVDSILSDQSWWLTEAAKKLENWVVLCILADLKRINHPCNFGKIPDPIAEGVEVDATLGEMSRISGESKTDLETLFKAMSGRVRTLYQGGKQDSVFKGKWYPFILERAIKTSLGRRRWHSRNFAQRLTSVALATVDFDGAWAASYKERLSQLLAP